MRMDQYIGLNKWARDKVLRQVRVVDRVVREFPDGRMEEFSVDKDIFVADILEVGVLRGVFDDVVAPFRRFRIDGEIFEDFIQAEPWSSGPCYFIALKKFNPKSQKWEVVPESLWSSKEINDA